MYKMLFMTAKPQTWLSAWGVWFSCKTHNDGFICPLGWERELTLKGIEFTEIEIVEPTN